MVQHWPFGTTLVQHQYDHIVGLGCVLSLIVSQCMNLGDLIHLVANRDLLDRAGFRPVDRHEIVKEKSVEELNAQLVSLVGDDGAEMLISAFRSRKSISGPLLSE